MKILSYYEFTINYAIIPNTISLAYLIFYTCITKSHQTKNKLIISFIWTITHLFVTTNILGYLFLKLSNVITPSLLSTNCYTGDSIFTNFFIFITDFFVKSFTSSLIFYIGHRFFHTPYMYKNFHKQHHKYSPHVEPLSTFDVGFVEFNSLYIIPGLIPFLSGYILFQKPCINIWPSYIHQIFTISYSVYLHTPNPLKYDPFKLWPFSNSKRHHLHHKLNNCNYSAPSNDLPDYLFGTLHN